MICLSGWKTTPRILKTIAVMDRVAVVLALPGAAEEAEYSDYSSFY